MKPIAYLIALGAVVFFSGCETDSVTGSSQTRGESAVRGFSLDGLKIGDRVSSLDRFAQVQRVPFGRAEVYEIYNPNESISLALATFEGGRLKTLELRYFDSPSVRTLSAVGGWLGLQNYLVTKFGNPSRVGSAVPVATTADGINPKYAKINAEWIFSRQNRRIHYIALSDASGGIAVVTVSDTTPVAAAAQPVVGGSAPAARTQDPVVRRNDPGF